LCDDACTCLGHGVRPDEATNKPCERHFDVAGDIAADTAEESVDSTARSDTTQPQGACQTGSQSPGIPHYQHSSIQWQLQHFKVKLSN